MAGLNETTSSERVHISFFGRRNAGKSSLINALTGQKLAIVSSTAGTTTDPVSKAMELLPLGPVILTDTAGLDDDSDLGALRIEKTLEVLLKTDIAVIVVDASIGVTDFETDLISDITIKKIPYLTVYNKCDLISDDSKPCGICVSSFTGEGIEEFKNRLASFLVVEDNGKLTSDLASNGDVVLLVTPIDSSAPKGRIILPQQQVLRDLLDHNALPMFCRETEISAALEKLSVPPKIVICDSQVFGLVSKLVPESIPLTSFSMLMARYKGNFKEAVKGAAALDNIKTGDKILISEGCTHHRQCEDIGTIKLPNFIRKYTNCEPEFEFTSGGEFPGDLSSYKLVIHCGGCMLRPRDIANRYNRALEAGVPMTNYGIAIAKIHGILDRASKPLVE